MKNARDGAAAILLQNGQVLVAGGNTNTVQFATAELYNPANGHWTLTGSMNTANPGALTLLQNGQVLSNGADVELYNPSTGKWTVTGSMHTARYNFTQTSLPTGKVLVAGGYDKTCPSSCPGLSSAELYDPSTGTWSMTGSMHTGRWAHTATLLANGLVLVAGGYEGPGASNGLASAERTRSVSSSLQPCSRAARCSCSLATEPPSPGLSCTIPVRALGLLTETQARPPNFLLVSHCSTPERS